MKRALGDRAFSIAVLVPFAIAVSYLHLAKGVPLKCFVYGSGSWGIGCVLKLVLYHGVVRRLPHDPAHIRGTATLNGLVSGLTELGPALVFFAFLPVLSFRELVAFGLGIGTIEAFLVATTSNPLQGTALESAAREIEDALARLSGGAGVVYGYLLPFAERLIAGGIHVGTRGLVYVGTRSSSLFPFALALSAFVLADGILGYRLTHERRLSELRTLNRTYLGLAAIAVVVLAAFLGLWPEGGYAPGVTAPGERVR